MRGRQGGRQGEGGRKNSVKQYNQEIDVMNVLKFLAVHLTNNVKIMTYEPVRVLLLFWGKLMEWPNK